MKALRKKLKTVRPRQAQVQTALVEIATKAGYRVIPVSAQVMAAAKGKSRAQDVRLITSGKATPQQIQKKNDRFPGAIEVLDWSPAFA